MPIFWATIVSPCVPILTYNFSKGTNPLGRIKLVYPDTLEHMCNYRFAYFFFKFFFDNPFVFPLLHKPKAV